MNLFYLIFMHMHIHLRTKDDGGCAMTTKWPHTYSQHENSLDAEKIIITLW